MTDREREALVAIAKGLSNEELADTLFSSENTVKTHVSGRVGGSAPPHGVRDGHVVETRLDRSG